MIELRNPNEIRSRTRKAAEAMEVGCIVRQVAPAKAGETLEVRKVTQADLDAVNGGDKKVILGMVNYIPDNNLAVSYKIDPVTQRLTLNGDEDGKMKIPAGAFVEFWRLQPVVGVRKEDVGPELVAAWASAKEGDVITVRTDTAKLEKFDAAAATPADTVVGYVERVDGFALTINITLF